MTHSQNTSDTREITYKSLTEFAKYVAFRDSATVLFSQFKIELASKDNIIDVRGEKINLLEIYAIKADSISLAKDNLLEIGDLKLKNEKGKKWQYGVGGTLLGMILAFLLSK